MNEILAAHLVAESGQLVRDFDREPFGFHHNLSTMDLLSMDAIERLARKYATRPSEYFVASAASAASVNFSSVPHGQCGPSEALERLDDQPLRLLLKRPENVDPSYRTLLETLTQQVVELRNGLQRAKVVRLESAIFVTSPHSITPCHFDPEIGFFSQIAGEKTYHIYSPLSVGEAQLESFYFRGSIEICEVELTGLSPSYEHVFRLTPGLGLHQPQNSPHWVETGTSKSISFTFVLETDVSRIRNRARAFNHLIRQAGMQPRTVGDAPMAEAVKAGAMRVVIPLRRRTKRLTAQLASRRQPTGPSALH